MLTKETFTLNDVKVQMDLAVFDVCMDCGENIRNDEYYVTMDDGSRYCSDACLVNNLQKDGIITYRNK